MLEIWKSRDRDRDRRRVFVNIYISICERGKGKSKCGDAISRSDFFFFCWPEGGKYCLTCFGREKREGCVPGRLRGNVDLGGDLRRDPAVGRGLGVVYMCTK